MFLLTDIKRLREETGVGVMDARKALEESKGDIRKAGEWLKKNAVAKALKKADRTTGDGAIFSYVHQTGKISAMVKLGCETDFVARTDDFQKLGKELTMQIASMKPKNVDELYDQDWIRDNKKKIKQIIDEVIAKVGENIKILEMVRMSF
ncbi:translation elongation factor Ts [Candidatus Collierbacteria bacterium]|nr:translation elongation factor Ts [Candidatus Collierbacteria bacterium]